MLKQYFEPKEFITTSIILLACLLMMLFDPTSTDLFRYQSKEVTNGEFWRIISANFTHSNWNHFFLNMAGLLLIDYLFQPLIKQWLRATLISFCIFTNVLLLHSFVVLEWYVGMSGALHGFILGCALLSWGKAKITNSLIILGTSAKLFVELNWEINASTAGLIEANVVEESHLFGAISGLVFWGLFLLINWRKLDKDKKGA